MRLGVPAGYDVEERSLSPDEVWNRYERTLDRPIAEGLNTAHEMCDRWARNRARIAIVVRHANGDRDSWTFEELSRASRRLSSAFSAWGLRRGDRIGAIVGRQIEAWIGALATWRAGLVYVPVFGGLGTEAAAQRLNDSGAAVVIVDAAFRSSFEECRGLLDRDVEVVTITGDKGRDLRKGDRSFWSEIDRHSDSFETVRTAANDAATILFTSGTTSRPKGCVLPHSALLSVQPFVRHALALTESDLFFTTADPGWAYGLYTTGACVSSIGVPRVMYSGAFDKGAWLKAIDQEQITYLSGAPSALRRVVAKERDAAAAPSLRGTTCAGEPLDATLAKDWRERFGHDLQDGYGLTEVGMVLASLSNDRQPRAGALSSVVPGFEVRLVDANGHESDREGVLHVRRPRYQIAIGYWGRDELWAQRWDGDYFSTGDIFRRDDEGYWSFVAREDDLIVTSGYKIGPAEIETVLISHEGVADVAVVAEQDAARGHVVRAVVVRRTGSITDSDLAEELRELVRHRMGRHVYPRTIDFVEELPRNEAGKLRRSVLRS